MIDKYIRAGLVLSDIACYDHRGLIPTASSGNTSTEHGRNCWASPTLPASPAHSDIGYGLGAHGQDLTASTRADHSRLVITKKICDMSRAHRQDRNGHTHLVPTCKFDSATSIYFYHKNEIGYMPLPRAHVAAADHVRERAGGHEMETVRLAVSILFISTRREWRNRNFS